MIQRIEKKWDLPLNHLFLVSQLYAKPNLISPHTPIIRDQLEHYRLETAQSRADLKEVFKLRNRVFFEELQGRSKPLALEIDEFDFRCTHLMIRETATGKTVGTYRLLPSTQTNRFYSESEFDLSELLSKPGIKLELGRACIDQNHRNGTVLALLWRGISQMMKETRAEILFGCSSVPSLDPMVIESLSFEMERMKAFEEHLQIHSRGEFPRSSPLIRPILPSSESPTLPPLIRSYLLSGAKVGREPFYDFDFQCVDFFTLLELKNLSPAFRRRYFSWLT
ncbi:MAG: GNAT family N-acetyltransferase [Proteobacteria bacterium]|nr:MAG: GNAT family N-acetyltransferase [Pseudomonadota bacterium]